MRLADFMLSHDMRSPLQTVQMTAQYLGKLNAGADVSDAARRQISSGAYLQALLDDLVDFNRTNLGLGINIVRSQADLGAICGEELEQLRVAYPDSSLQLEVKGDCQGSWDAKRVRQLLGNLVVNAVHYGETNEVRVGVVGREADVRIEVSNSGPAIDQATDSATFRATTARQRRQTTCWFGPRFVYRPRDCKGPWRDRGSGLRRSGDGLRRQPTARQIVLRYRRHHRRGWLAGERQRQCDPKPLTRSRKAVLGGLDVLANRGTRRCARVANRAPASKHPSPRLDGS